MGTRNRIAIWLYQFILMVFTTLDHHWVYCRMVIHGIGTDWYATIWQTHESRQQV